MRKQNELCVFPVTLDIAVAACKVRGLSRPILMHRYGLPSIHAVTGMLPFGMIALLQYLEPCPPAAQESPQQFLHPIVAKGC